MPELAALREEIAGLRAAAVAATKTAHLNRRTIRWLTAVTVLLVAACVWLAFVAVAARDAGSATRVNRRANLVACQAANQTRVDSATLWEHVLDIVGPLLPPSEQARALDDLHAAINVAYASKDCQKLAAGVTP